MDQTLDTTADIQVTTAAQSRLPQVDWDKLTFGAAFSDHMFAADYDGKAWQHPRIMPYGSMELSPASSGIHYGQSIFEGMKAFRDKDGGIQLFRPRAHLRRMNRSAEQLAMPPIPEELFMQALHQLLELDHGWLGQETGGQLYIRPAMFGTDPFLGVRPSQTYRFLLFTCPVNAYYTNPLDVLVEPEQVRAEPGGVGSAKTAGNYARTMKREHEAKAEGYGVVMWLDGHQHRYVNELSTMNAFFRIGNTILTPEADGTILEGITRDCAIQLLREQGYTVEPRPVDIHEVMEAGRNGSLKEAFGTGTAAVVMPLKSLSFRGEMIEPAPVDTWEAAPFIKETLRKIRVRETSDPHGWLEAVKA